MGAADLYVRADCQRGRPLGRVSAREYPDPRLTHTEAVPALGQTASGGHPTCECGLISPAPSSPALKRLRGMCIWETLLLCRIRGQDTRWSSRLEPGV